MPATINPMQRSRTASADSPKATNADRHRADCANPRPNGVSGAERQIPHCQIKQGDTDHHRDNGGRKDQGPPVCGLEPHRPADLKQPRRH